MVAGPGGVLWPVTEEDQMFGRKMAEDPEATKDWRWRARFYMKMVVRFWERM
jgi:hypothetical protein